MRIRRSKYGGASFSKGENSRGGDFCFSIEKEQQLLANIKVYAPLVL